MKLSRARSCGGTVLCRARRWRVGSIAIRGSLLRNLKARPCLLRGVQVDVEAQAFQCPPCISLGSQLAYRADNNISRSAAAIGAGLPPTEEPDQIAVLALDSRKTSFLIPCASRPFSASPHTSKSASRLNTSHRDCRTCGLSSTRRTLLISRPSLDDGCNAKPFRPEMAKRCKSLSDGLLESCRSSEELLLMSRDGGPYHPDLGPGYVASRAAPIESR